MYKYTSEFHSKSPSAYDIRNVFSRSRISVGTMHSRVNSEKVFSFKVKPKESRKASVDSRTVLLKQIKQIEEECLAIRSDKLELQRDLAVYEHNCCRAISVAANLVKVNRTTNSLSSLTIERQIDSNFSEITDLYERISESQQTLFNDLKTGLRQVQSIETQQDSPVIEVREDFCLRDPIDFKKRLVFKGTCRISGICVMYRVLGSPFASFLQVHVQTMAGDLFNLRVKPNDNSNTMRHTLLSKLHFVLRSEQLQLSYHEKHGIDFLTLMIELKGSNLYVSSVFLQWNEEELIIQLADNPSKVYVPIAMLTKQRSILKEKSLMRTLEKHLYFNEDLKVLEWLTDRELIFKSKEEFSNYLDEFYIAHTTEFFSYIPLFKGTLLSKGNLFTILLLTSHQKFKLEVSFGDSTRVISQQSGFMKLLTNLQFREIGTEFLTLMRSLELEFVVRKLFKL